MKNLNRAYWAKSTAAQIAYAERQQTFPRSDMVEAMEEEQERQERRASEPVDCVDFMKGVRK